MQHEASTGAPPAATALPSVSAGLRERKKVLTRLAIEDAALRLFTERGFVATSIEDIAEVAVVSPRTVRRYFGSKEQIVFARPHAVLGQTEDLLGSRPPHEPLAEALAVVLGQLAHGFEEAKEQWAMRRSLIEAVPAVAAFYVWTLFSMEDALRRFIADRHGLDPDTQHAHLASAATVAAFRASVEVWLLEDRRPLADIVAENLYAAVTPLLGPGATLFAGASAEDA